MSTKLSTTPQDQAGSCLVVRDECVDGRSCVCSSSGQRGTMCRATNWSVVLGASTTGDTIVSAGTVGTPGCGGGTTINTEQMPSDVINETPVLPSNTGGGGGGNLLSNPTPGSDGVVLIRYRIPRPAPVPAPMAPPTLSALGKKVPTSKPTFSGTGQPGASITVSRKGKALCSSTVDASGNWSCTAPRKLKRGKYDVQATQVVAGNSQTHTVGEVQIRPGQVTAMS